jgi:hypothetical protein
MIVATPASVERAFADHGALVSRVGTPPEICYPAGCSGIMLWGGAKPIYFKPRTGKDFMVILFKTRADAVKLARLETKGGIAAARHGSVLLLYYRLSARLGRLRAALASSG